MIKKFNSVNKFDDLEKRYFLSLIVMNRALDNFNSLHAG